jgi:guanylate kinase
MHTSTKIERSGILFVVSGPSGSGKSTVCSNLKQTADFKYSVSCTTRKPRPGEEDGVDYHFLSEEQFDQHIQNGDFLEWAQVHQHRYGTLKSVTRDTISAGVDLLLDIDVSGAQQIRQSREPWLAGALVDIFIMPPTFEELERRLRKRGTESEEQIQIRMKTAQAELPHWRDYRYVILSETMEEDLQKIRAIIRAERYRTSRIKLGLPLPPSEAHQPAER